MAGTSIRSVSPITRGFRVSRVKARARKAAAHAPKRVAPPAAKKTARAKANRPRVWGQTHAVRIFAKARLEHAKIKLPGLFDDRERIGEENQSAIVVTTPGKSVGDIQDPTAGPESAIRDPIHYGAFKLAETSDDDITDLDLDFKQPFIRDKDKDTDPSFPRPSTSLSDTEPARLADDMPTLIDGLPVLAEPPPSPGLTAPDVPEIQSVPTGDQTNVPTKPEQSVKIAWGGANPSAIPSRSTEPTQPPAKPSQKGVVTEVIERHRKKIPPPKVAAPQAVESMPDLPATLVLPKPPSKTMRFVRGVGRVISWPFLLPFRLIRWIIRQFR